MEQVKTFCKSGRTGIETGREATEKECNKWLWENQSIEIIARHVTGTQHDYTITIWYEGEHR